MTKRTTTSLALAAVAVGAGTFIYISNKPVAEAPTPVVTTEQNQEVAPVVPGDFLYPTEPTSTPVVAPAPEQQPDPGTEETVTPVPPVKEPPMTQAQCRPGGCSGQLCTDKPDMVTTCEWREEYACYQTATCERQPSGECGWTKTEELQQCLTTGGLQAI